jgi:hypothetical protein
MREKASFQRGMMWQFERILDRHISRRLYGRTTFSTWHPHVSLDGHSPMRRTNTNMFTIVNMHTDNFVSFVSHAKQMVRFFLLLPFFFAKQIVRFFLLPPFFYLLFFIIYLTANIFILQATILGRESSSKKLFVETHVRSDDCQKEVQQFVDSWAQQFLVCWFSTIFFIKL